MPFCPNCKSEYLTGRTTCADCNITLVDALEQEEFAADIIDSDIDPTHQDSDIDLNLFEDDDTTTSYETFGDDVPSKKSNQTYVYKDVAYKEHRSSAFLYLFFAIAGYTYIGLNIAKVLYLVDNAFSYTVLFALFSAVLGLSIYSFHKAHQIAPGIEAEKELTQKINEYLKELGDLTSIDEESFSNLMEEERYFKRINKLKQLVALHFENLDEAYLDLVVEEFYDSYYENI